MKKEILHEHQIGRKIYLKKIGFLPEFYGVSLEGKNNDWKIENNFLPSLDLDNRRFFKFLNWKILISYFFAAKKIKDIFEKIFSKRIF